MEGEDQLIRRDIKTRHLEALRDLQKSENDRLQKIKNDPSRLLSRHYETDSAIAEDSLPVKQLWAGALKASISQSGERLAVTKNATRSNYQSIGLGHVKSKIGQWEQFIVITASSVEQVGDIRTVDTKVQYTKVEYTSVHYQEH
jgi:hypothetical protein